jgi:hypothetical protein
MSSASHFGSDAVDRHAALPVMRPRAVLGNIFCAERHPDLAKSLIEILSWQSIERGNQGILSLTA